MKRARLTPDYCEAARRNIDELLKRDDLHPSVRRFYVAARKGYKARMFAAMYGAGQ